MRSTFSIIALVALLALLLLPSCTMSGGALPSIEPAAASSAVNILSEQVAAARLQLLQMQQQQAELMEQAASQPAAVQQQMQEDSDRLSRGMDSIRAVLDKLEPALRQMQANLPEQPTLADISDESLKAAAPFVPPPWNVWVPLVLGISGWVRAWYNRTAGRKVASSVNGVVSAAKLDDLQKIQIGAIQGSAGKRLVDEAQGKKIALPV